MPTITDSCSSDAGNDRLQIVTQYGQLINNPR